MTHTDVVAQYEVGEEWVGLCVVVAGCPDHG